jgi:hypothetical protein
MYDEAPNWDGMTKEQQKVTGALSLIMERGSKAEKEQAKKFVDDFQSIQQAYARINASAGIAVNGRSRPMQVTPASEGDRLRIQQFEAFIQKTRSTWGNWKGLDF